MTASETRLRPVRDGQLLRFAADPAGRPVRVVAGLDATDFARTWLQAVEVASRG